MAMEKERKWKGVTDEMICSECIFTPLSLSLVVKRSSVYRPLEHREKRNLFILYEVLRKEIFAE